MELRLSKIDQKLWVKSSSNHTWYGIPHNTRFWEGLSQTYVNKAF